MADRCPHCGFPTSHLAPGNDSPGPPAKVPEKETELSQEKVVAPQKGIDESKSKRLGGWLILLGTFLLAQPISVVLKTIPHIQNILDGWVSYTTKIKFLLVVEQIWIISALLFSFILLSLFFKRHYLFPKAYIVFVIIHYVWIPVFCWLILRVEGEQAAIRYIRNFINSFNIIAKVLWPIAWIHYLLRVPRPKLTFVRGKPETEAADGKDVSGKVEAGTDG